METRQSVLDVGDLIQIKAESLNYSARAVGRANGLVVFIGGGIPGDKLLARITQIKKNYAVAETVDVLSPSPHRCNPPCVHFMEGCGGCQWQHIAYEYQIEWKKEVVRQALKRIGKLEHVPDIEIRRMESPLRYRNRLRLFRAGDSGVLGMRKPESHQVAPVRECLISNDLINSLSSLFRGEILSTGIELDEVSILTSVRYQQIMLSCTYHRISPVIQSHVDRLSDMPDVVSVFYRTVPRSGRPGKLMHGYGEPVIKEEIRGIEYKINPDCFFQVNTSGLEMLVNLVREFAGTGNRLALDAHCGVGTFALQIADDSDVIWGTDTSSSAVALARSNAADNGVANAHFRRGSAYSVLENELRDARIDLVILDPPRKGCEKADLRAVINSLPKKLIYISCNPTTLARDLQGLTNAGYRLLRLTMVDMFPMTYHLEVVSLLLLLAKGRGKRYNC